MAAFMNVRSQKYYPERITSRSEDYHSLYRFREENVNWLAEHFLGQNNETRGGALSTKKQMQIFLRFLSDPGFQIGIGKEEGVHRSTVSKTISFVLPKIVAKVDTWIKFPDDNTNKALADWSAHYRFPCAIGAIDCTHVPILKPSQHGDEYVNRKGYCSINVQATCNGKEEFTSVDAQWPGSVHDSRILRRSFIYHEMNNRRRNHELLLGDIGYGITPWLLTPYKTPATPAEIAYNKLHKKERVIIERCFGQLKRRFPVLQHPVRVANEKIPLVIISCCVLHNVAKYLKDNLPNDDEVEDLLEENDENNEEIEENQREDLRQRGQQRRREIQNIIYQLRGNNQ
jgi:hypothetical protein